jgi:hypothetical protein
MKKKGSNEKLKCFYCSTGSKSVSTPFHFALLMVEECRVKQYLDNVRKFFYLWIEKCQGFF